MKSSKTHQVRHSYATTDNADRQAQLTSRTDILSKSFATDLWMRVIGRAIDDAALYMFMRCTGVELSEEDVEYEESANGFLFDDSYRIPMDDYLVDISCPKCQTIWSLPMSQAAGSDSICPSCNNKMSWKYTTYVITESQVVRDISLEDLISLWGVEDISAFRNGCKNRIDGLVAKKMKSARRPTNNI